MLSQVSKWGNSQGIRISKKLLQTAQIGLDEKVEIKAKDNMLIILPASKKSLAWYLDGYEGEPDRYDWGNMNEPAGREII
ncbi:MAG: AbrB/MazE/SpoVT family DNA-binding domain-containing protein [Defluviitaleaceae bacterium]|nr:AbrB/MazE/SpoVT family DNA-binding domain-containing protein [Defluviitaleaceae bacterium]